MQKKSVVTKVLKIILGLSVILTLFFQFIKPSTLYNDIDLSLYSFSSYLKYVFFQSPAKTIDEAVSGFVSLNTVQQENKILKQNLDQVKQIQSRLIEANKEISELQALLNLKQTITSMDVISANVIEKDSTNFNNNLLINVGSLDGVKLAMAVITPEGLIGQISEVEDHYSIVKLLTSQEGNNRFAVKIQLDSEKSVEAILEGYDIENGEYIVRLLDSTQEVSENLKVVTSGLGEVVPGGILVGEVKSIESSPATLSVILKVKPVVSYSNINAVLIVSKP